MRFRHWFRRPCSANPAPVERGPRNNRCLLPSGETLLTSACKEGLQDIVAYYLQIGLRCDELNSSGRSALHVSLANRRSEIVWALLKAGANPNIVDSRGVTPLHLACWINDRDLVKCLLEAGASLKVADTNSGTVGSGPLLAAVINNNLALVEDLLRAGAKVDCTDFWGNTPLHKACQKNFYEIALLLLDHNADQTLLNKSGSSAIYYAMTMEHNCELIKYFLNNAVSKNVLRQLVIGKSDKVAVPFQQKKHGQNPGYSLLALAIHKNCHECYESIVNELPESVHLEDGNDCQPIVYAFTNKTWTCYKQPGDNSSPSTNCIECRHSLFASYVSLLDESRIEFARALLMKGAQIRTLWDAIVWKIRPIKSCANETINIFIRGMRFDDRSCIKVQVFYRQLAIANLYESLWLLYVAGFNPDDEEITLAINKSDIGELPPDASIYHPARWMPYVGKQARTLQNICTIVIRKHLGAQRNIFFNAKSLVIPQILEDLIILRRTDHADTLRKHCKVLCER